MSNRCLRFAPPFQPILDALEAIEQTARTAADALKKVETFRSVEFRPLPEIKQAESIALAALDAALDAGQALGTLVVKG
jgi:hypothetical protein